MILRIESRPPRNYYQRPEEALPAGEASHQILQSVGDLNSSALGELATLEVLLGDKAKTLMQIPPIGAAAVLIIDGVVQHSGRVVRVSWLGNGIAVEVQP